MKNKDLQIIKQAKKTILLEAEAIRELTEHLDNQFVETVKLIYRSQGRVVITGIGKSANIAQKMVATFNSTGTPAIFMHAADAIHGDLGIVQNDDVLICISKSGNTPEIKVLIPLIKKFGNKIIAMVSNRESFLAQQADYVLHTKAEKEACPNNLAPTTSTTVQLVMGDALAVCLLDYRNFSSNDFARLHPGGALGKKLYMRVEDLYTPNAAPQVHLNDSLETVIMEISSKLKGSTAVLNEKKQVVGIITDGDLRRMLQKAEKIDTLTAKDLMSHQPKTVKKGTLAITAFHLMQKNKIMQIIVTEGDSYVGMVHMHEILKEGIV